MFENPAIRALILASIAGAATLLGALSIIFVKKKNEKALAISLGFAAGVMLSVSFTDLFPAAKELISSHVGIKRGILLNVAFLALGILISASLDRFVPHQEFDEESGDKPHNNLFRVGFVSMMAIGLHNFPEGIATFMAAYDNLALGVSITIAISLHNIPEGIAVSMPLYFATGSRKKALKAALLSGIAEPIGALIAFLLLRPFINDFVLGSIFSIVAGIMVYISVEELIPSSRQYGHDRLALIATFMGICIMPLTTILQY